MDVATGERVASGLCLPHSPRWHDGQLWLLESGTGSLGTLDGGMFLPAARLPGFTRGLDFAGRYAFVGLGKVRDTAEGACGVWVIDLRTGAVAGTLRFDGPSEVLSLVVLPRRRGPVIVSDDRELLAETFVLPAPTW
jgi:uncharacterized protein (TIGR03032 family)